MAGTQFAFFSAVAAMDVGPALLIEYTAPAAVVVWLWLRHGERPRPLTLAGAGIAALGLVLVLDLLSGADLALGGVLWALAAMLGAATYFVMSADTRTGVPPLALAGGGLAVGAVGLGVLGVVGVLPMRATTAAPTYAGEAVPWWLPFVGLGVITAALAYTTGIAASRRLGSRLASFVALLEVVAAVGFAWLLLDQLPGTLQLVGGAFVLAGVVVVKLGERPPRATPPTCGPCAQRASRPRSGVVAQRRWTRIRAANRARDHSRSACELDRRASVPDRVATTAATEGSRARSRLAACAAARRRSRSSRSRSRTGRWRPAPPPGRR